MMSESGELSGVTVTVAVVGETAPVAESTSIRREFGGSCTRSTTDSDDVGVVVVGGFWAMRPTGMLN